nr:hypothetical protein [Candidatus Sigynarchaeota archaeon]
MNTKLGPIELKPLKAIRSPKQDHFTLPDRKEIESAKHISLSQHFKEIPALKESSDVKGTSVIDDILLSLVWNNPVLSDIPVLGASTVDQPKGKKDAASRAAVVEEVNASNAVEQFLKPQVSLESLVSPSSDESLRNARSLYKIAISKTLRNTVNLNHGN